MLKSRGAHARARASERANEKYRLRGSARAREPAGGGGGARVRGNVFPALTRRISIRPLLFSLYRSYNRWMPVVDLDIRSSSLLSLPVLPSPP